MQVVVILQISQFAASPQSIIRINADQCSAKVPRNNVSILFTTSDVREMAILESLNILKFKQTLTSQHNKIDDIN